jgi:hypothetical protein
MLTARQKAIALRVFGAGFIPIGIFEERRELK